MLGSNCKIKVMERRDVIRTSGNRSWCRNRKCIRHTSSSSRQLKIKDNQSPRCVALEIVRGKKQKSEALSYSWKRPPLPLAALLPWGWSNIWATAALRTPFCVYASVWPSTPRRRLDLRCSNYVSLLSHCYCFYRPNVASKKAVTGGRSC